MTLSEFQVDGYRSLKSVFLRLKRVNVVVGANGCGKSNLYKSLRLIACAAEGRLASSIAEEGGMPSILWAGARNKGPVRMKLTLKLDGGLKYELACGLPIPGASPFPQDPVVKEEKVSFLTRQEKITLLSRDGQLINARDNSGKRISYAEGAPESESVLAELKEPHRFPELSALRQQILSWRFYHKFRTDDLSPLRQDQNATRTMCLSHDGSDLAAALKTIDWVGDQEALHKAVDNAFPGANLEMEESGGRMKLKMRMVGFDRGFDARELSDGTLHYLCLLAALLSPRPSGLIALNEPESSIHPDLLVPLADLIAASSRLSQLWIITHSFTLAELIATRCKVDPIELEKVDGATKIKGQKLSADD